MINFDAYQLQRGRSNLFYQKMALDINKKSIINKYSMVHIFDTGTIYSIQFIYHIKHFYFNLIIPLQHRKVDVTLTLWDYSQVPRDHHIM